MNVRDAIANCNSIKGGCLEARTMLVTSSGIGSEAQDSGVKLVSDSLVLCPMPSAEPAKREARQNIKRGETEK